MADYTAVKKAMAAGTPPEIICAACPWDRLCITPPAVSTTDVDAMIAEAEAADRSRDPQGHRMPTTTLLTAMTMAGRDTMGDLCPVFALRLRAPEGRQLADKIRAAMREAAE
jgi:hypothetical protein